MGVLSDVLKLKSKDNKGTMNVLTKFHSNLSDNCKDILLKTTNFHLMLMLEKSSGHHQSH